MKNKIKDVNVKAILEIYRDYDMVETRTQIIEKKSDKRREEIKDINKRHEAKRTYKPK